MNHAAHELAKLLTQCYARLAKEGRGQLDMNGVPLCNTWRCEVFSEDFIKLVADAGDTIMTWDTGQASTLYAALESGYAGYSVGEAQEYLLAARLSRVDDTVHVAQQQATQAAQLNVSPASLVLDLHRLVA